MFIQTFPSMIKTQSTSNARSRKLPRNFNNRLPSAPCAGGDGSEAAWSSKGEAPGNGVVGGFVSKVPPSPSSGFEGKFNPPLGQALGDSWK